ncbi:MAG TPA: glycerol-3-phosphate dehydrogenase, partial [Actinomycetes bacterium]|nr:glycerol-3-phosphate dehydrogenase [Actinomycetes bacterium]
RALAAMAAAGQTVEGAPAARLALELATRHQLDLPLLAAVNRVLDGAGDPAAELAAAVLPSA